MQRQDQGQRGEAAWEGAILLDELDAAHGAVEPLATVGRLGERLDRVEAVPAVLAGIGVRGHGTSGCQRRAESVTVRVGVTTPVTGWSCTSRGTSSTSSESKMTA